MAGNQIRAGGTTSLPPDKFDEEADFLAATINSSISDTQGTANLNCLSKDLDKALELFFDMLRNPGFQQNVLICTRTRCSREWSDGTIVPMRSRLGSGHG